jgi:uncharacterized tellurite resistance protein B-like protein
MTNRGLLWLLNETLSFKVVPPPMDYENFGKLLLTCACGDGRITAAERAWVVGYLDAFGAPDSALEVLAAYDGRGDLAQIIASSPTVKMSATSAVYEAIRACSADGELHRDEVRAIERAATALGVPAATVGDLVELYHEEQFLRSKRLRKLFPEGAPFQG